MDTTAITCRRCKHSLPLSTDLPGNVHLDQITQLGAVYDEEIANLETTLASLKVKRVHLFREENNLRPSLWRLPVEIVKDIFSLTCSEDVITDLTHTPKVLALIRVCTRFRHICLSSPSLWSSISLVFEDEEPGSTRSGPTVLANADKFNMVRHRLETFLSNSADQLLTVRIDAFHVFRASRHVNEEVLLERFCKSAHRWAHLTLCSEAAEALSNAMEGRAFSSLTSVTLHPASDQGDRFYHPPRLDKSLFVTASMLKLVDNRGCNDNAITVPWEQVTNLYTGERFWFSYGDFDFQKLRNLKTWEAGFSNHYLVEHDRLSFTHFEGLTSLTLYKSYYSSKGLLGYITAPSLVDLSVTDTDLSAGTLVAFLERSSCHITSFTLCRITFTAEDIIECLRQTPRLHTLSLSEDEKEPFMCTSLLDHLSSSFQSQENAASQVTLPALHDLTLGGAFNGCREALITMLRSWAVMPGKPSFEEGRRRFAVRIYDNLEYIDECFVEDLMSMDKEGLLISISWEFPPLP